MILAYPPMPSLVCAVCLFIAVAVGAYRQWCLHVWEVIEILPSADDWDNKSRDLRLSAYAPGWKSNNFRVGSWLVVAACSTLGGAWESFFLRGSEIEHGIQCFLGILLIRWLLSAALGISAASFALRRQETGCRGQQTEKQATGYRL